LLPTKRWSPAADETTVPLATTSGCVLVVLIVTAAVCPTVKFSDLIVVEADRTLLSCRLLEPSNTTAVVALDTRGTPLLQFSAVVQRLLAPAPVHV
jgi:hypothetical protein